MTENEKFLEELLKKKKPEDGFDGSDGEPADDEDDDQNFVDLQEEQEIEEMFEEVEEVIDVLKGSSAIKPESNQQRNLDRETGGLEANAEKATFTSEDSWDERSEEVDRMGTNDPLSTGNKKSLRLLQIKKKKQKEEEKKMHQNPPMKTLKTGLGKNYDSSKQQSGGFRQMIKARQDFGHETGNDGRGGMGR